jgi:mannosyltransferase
MISLGRKRYLTHFLLILALLLGTTLRLYRLGDKGFWGDEIWTAQAAEYDLGYILTHSGVVPENWRPPLYLVMAHFAVSLGSKEFAIRLPAMIFGTLGIAMIYRLGRLFYDKTVGSLAALLLAISPYHLWYSQEARWYSQLAFFSMMSLFFFYRFVLPRNGYRKSSMKDGLGFVVGTTLVLYTHLSAFLILPAQVLFAGYVWSSQLLTGKKRERIIWFRTSSLFLRFSLSLIVILLLALRLLLPILSPTSTPVSMSSDLKITLRLNFHLPDYASMMRFIGGLLAAYSAGNTIVVYLFIGLFLLGLFFTARRQFSVAVLILLWLVGPFLAAPFWQSKFDVLPRYLIFLLPVYLVVVAKGVAVMGDRIWTSLQIRSRCLSKDSRPATGERRHGQHSGIGISLAIMATLLGLQLPAIHLNYLQGKQTDWRGLARYVEQHVRPGDVIVGEAWFQAAFTYYFNRLGDVSIINVSAIDEAVPILTDLVAQRRRVWYVAVPAVFDDQPGRFVSETDNVSESEQRYTKDYSASINFVRENLSLVNAAEWEDHDFAFTSPQDSYFALGALEPLARLNFHDGFTPAQVEFADIRQAEWTTVSHRGVPPSAMTRLYLQLAAGKPRSLELTYFDFPGRDLQIMVDDQPVGEIAGGDSATWKTYQAAVPSSAGDEILVALIATGTEAVGISKIRLEYIPAEIKFEDVTGASWTAESYKGIDPGESYQGWLALEASRPRRLRLTYFDFLGKDLRVLVDGQVVAEIIGGTSATWKTYTVIVPSASEDRVTFKLENPGHEPSGVSKIWLEYTDQE